MALNHHRVGPFSTDPQNIGPYNTSQKAYGIVRRISNLLLKSKTIDDGRYVRHKGINKINGKWWILEGCIALPE
jgi:hypothetical protein